MRPSARVSVGDSATEAGGVEGVLPSMFHLYAEAEDKLSSVYKKTGRKAGRRVCLEES